MKEWFEGKTVAVVGNAASLLEKNYGKEIDTAEVVVRINRGGYKFTQFSNKMGMKLDVWCMQNIRQNKPWAQQPASKNAHKMQMDTIDVSPEFANMADVVFSNDDRNSLDSNLTKKSSTGLRVLYYISKQNPKNVNVYGFDWKQTYSWHEKRKCIAHNFEEEKKYCYDNFFNNQFELRN
tara:strand:+ start:11309 stop:11845 length:537 start_codon:yes stop_codon:yes gene_type:complete